LYNEAMARGWESKSVEAQQAEAREKTQPTRLRLTPQQAQSKRKAEGLHLARQRVLQQLNSVQNLRHRQMLEHSLADLDRQIESLKAG
jgi:hypothetical protein